MAYTYKSGCSLSFQKQYASKFQKAHLVQLQNLGISEITCFKNMGFFLNVSS